MYYERFIAVRYLRSGRFFTSISTIISLAGVTLGVAVVCFVMSMHNGFETELRTRLLGTTAHVSIFPTHDYTIEDYDKVVDIVETHPDVIAASPFIYYKAAISSEERGDGIVVRGILLEQERLTANIAEAIVRGDYDFDLYFLDTAENASGIIMGRSLAARLAVTIGDPVVMYSLRGEDLRRQTKPRIAKFYLTGIFETGFYEYDAQMAYIPLGAAQRLFEMRDEVTGVHAKLKNIFDAEEVAPVIEGMLGPGFNAVPWNELHKDLFTWIALEKKALFIGFILIVLVAAFSIISTLVMLAMEKNSDIGILKTMGSTAASIRKIFLFDGLAIGIFGTLCGTGVSLIAAWIQNKYHIISLPGELYFISYLPIRVQPLDYVAIGAITMVICLLAALYPAVRASRQSVIDVIRQ